MSKKVQFIGIGLQGNEFVKNHENSPLVTSFHYIEQLTKTMDVDSDSYYDYIYEADDGITSEGNHYSKLEKMGIRVVILDTGLTAGQAIIGLPKKYFGQVAFRDNGEVSFSDDYLFLEDKRVWKAKLYAHGFAKDNNAFALLDLTGLTANI